MTTQREPDTSAEGLRKALKSAREAIAKAPDDTWGHDTMGDADVPGGLMSWPVKDEILHNIDAALADAAGQAAPVPPPVELETTAEQRDMGWLIIPRDSQRMFAKLLRDFERLFPEHIRANAEHARAEGLAKEVERLQDEGRFLSTALADKRGLLEAAEAKLAVYEAPVPDEEVEDAVRGLGIVRDLIMSKRTHLLGGKFAGLDAALTMLQADAALLRRLSREKAEAEAREAKLREALNGLRAAGRKVLDGLNARIDAAPPEAKPVFFGIVDLHDAVNGARAALASSSPTKEKSDG